MNPFVGKPFLVSWRRAYVKSRFDFQVEVQVSRWYSLDIAMLQFPAAVHKFASIRRDTLGEFPQWAIAYPECNSDRQQGTKMAARTTETRATETPAVPAAYHKDFNVGKEQSDILPLDRMPNDGNLRLIDEYCRMPRSRLLENNGELMNKFISLVSEYCTLVDASKTKGSSDGGSGTVEGSDQKRAPEPENDAVFARKKPPQKKRHVETGATHDGTDYFGGVSNEDILALARDLQQKEDLHFEEVEKQLLTPLKTRIDLTTETSSSEESGKESKIVTPMQPANAVPSLIVSKVSPEGNNEEKVKDPNQECGAESL